VEIMRVAVCQLALAVGNIEANRAAGLDAVNRACDEGADLVVLPELSDSGYVFASLAEARSLASPLSESATIAAWVSLANERDVAIAGGWCELGADGRLYNSAALVGPDGLCAVYRKLHLWDREREVFLPGDQLSPLIEIDGVRIGLAICYDLEFPELIRLLALAGVDLVVVPTNWPASAVPEGERPIEFVKAQANAATNGIWIALADRCGEERGVSWVGYSTILDPEGFPMAPPLEPDGPGMVIAEIDALRSRAKSITENNDLFADRREDVYELTVRSSSSR
jgi:predicted amidohydrolase